MVQGINDDGELKHSSAGIMDLDDFPVMALSLSPDLKVRGASSSKKKTLSNSDPFEVADVPKTLTWAKSSKWEIVSRWEKAPDLQI